MQIGDTGTKIARNAVQPICGATPQVCSISCNRNVEFGYEQILSYRLEAFDGCTTTIILLSYCRHYGARVLYATPMDIVSLIKQIHSGFFSIYIGDEQNLGERNVRRPSLDILRVLIFIYTIHCCTHARVVRNPTAMKQFT